MDNYDRAIRDCDKAVSLLKKNDELSSAYCNRGNAYFVKGNYDQAIRDYKKALELHSNSDAAKNLAVVSEKKRQRGY
jgi:tetratricopeptide (TPR) repeat protein